MAATDYKAISAGYAFKWTHELTQQLILWRGANKSRFTGKRNAALKGFEVFIREMGLEGKTTVAFVKKKWENLKQKYKELKNAPAGAEGEMSAANWQWYKMMGMVVESGPSSPPLPLSSSPTPGEVIFTVPSEEDAAVSNATALVFLQEYKHVHLPMAAQDFKDPAGTDELTEQLILWRSANKSLFTGRRNAAVNGFEVFIREMGLEGKVTVACVKKKWENLKQKFKLLNNPPAGRSAEGELTAANWKWYKLMGEAVGSLDHTISLAVGSSSSPADLDFSFPSDEGAAASCSTSSFTSTCTPTPATSSTAPEPPPTSPAPKRAKKEPEWLLAIKELERREEARDARQAEWERAMMEREKRRDQEMMEREERRDQEMREREERRDREMREREERLIAENREREDKQAREAAGREERFLALMDFLVKK
ncbi:uncharacterized protein LOC133141028 isoform X2 [Conger conger]|uniref:uncharacterized protein LOC133141028 isoform X2 n=1 Tax=Conger conger TaxID=82655 RepID=UPI002A59892F|nr:uncharacterized protein LOC133141028 isoform X2 [Conger conger]